MRILTSERLRLRRWRDEDADFVLDLRSRWEVQRFVGPNPQVIRDRDEALETITRWRGLDDGVRGVWAIEDRHGGPLLGALLLAGIVRSGTGDALRRPATVKTIAVAGYGGVILSTWEVPWQNV